MTSNSLTSRLAADSIVQHAPTLRLRVLQALLSAGDYGLTREELESATGLTGNTLRPRVVELMQAGTIAETDKTRKTRSGREATVLSALWRPNG